MELLDQSVLKRINWDTYWQQYYGIFIDGNNNKFVAGVNRQHSHLGLRLLSQPSIKFVFKVDTTHYLPLVKEVEQYLQEHTLIK